MIELQAADLRDKALQVSEWILKNRDSYGNPHRFIDGYAQKLREFGLPLDRITLHLRQLDPKLRARTFVWNHNSGGTVEVGRHYGIENTEMYLRSTVKPIFEGQEKIERRLIEKPADDDFPIVQDLYEEGFKHYLILALPQWGFGPAAISIATRKTEGFSPAELALIENCSAAFGAAIELQETRQLARTLLDTYVGHNAGERILNGAIRRGSTEEIHAILLYCDLRNFTPISEQHDQKEVIDLLNRYFETIAEPVQREGGEILKFIGDGLLAIYPCPANHIRDCTAAASALAASLEAQRAMEALASEVTGIELQCGIALHVGDVQFGNIGAADRLDFTVIGPAVNLVTRIEPFSKEAPGRIVVSREFAERHGGDFESLGVHALKGIAEQKEVLFPSAAG